MTGFRADGTLEERVEAASRVARENADRVDRDAEFPHEALKALRDQRLLAPSPLPPPPSGAVTPWSAAALVSAGMRIAAACGSTGLIWAMHQCLMQTVWRHRGDVGRAHEFSLAAWDTQPLLAGATSEMGIGGDLRSSRAHCEPGPGGSVVLDKEVPVASYAREADAIAVTARRSAESLPSDQVLVLARREETTIELRGTWDGIGMRGTLSEPVRMRCQVGADAVLPESFESIASQTLVPLSHLLWAACWTGIAIDAAEMARRHLRRAGRRYNPEVLGAKRASLGELGRALASLRLLIEGAAARFDGLDELPAAERANATGSSRFALDFTNLRLSAASLAVDCVIRAVELIGFDAYVATSPDSLSRHLRDVLSSKVMISADRIRASTAMMSLVTPEAFPDLDEPVETETTDDGEPFRGPQARTAAARILSEWRRAPARPTGPPRARR